MTQGIYCIENKTTGRKYYGSSVNIEKRLDSHKKQLLQKNHHNVLLQRSVDKYGIKDFTFTIVEETDFSSQRDLLLHEQTYLDDNDGGFNMAPANGGDILSNHPNNEAIRQQISSTLRQKNSNLTVEERKDKFGKTGIRNGMYGKTHSESTRKTISEANKGHSRNLGVKWSDEARKKYSESIKGKRNGPDNPFYGKTHSEETKRHLSEINVGKNWVIGLKPEEIPYTKQYELTYPDGSSIIVYGLKELATYFKCSIANVKNTIDRMNKGSLPSKRSVFYNHLIKIMD